MKSPDQILAMLKERQTGQGAIQARMASIRDTYNGDLVIPLPEIDRNERPAVANLAQVGIDQIGMRVASTLPVIAFPPARPGFLNAERRADHQRDITTGWFAANRMTTKIRRRSRWLAAYSCAPVVIRPDAYGLPKWYTRDPLGTYPAPHPDPDEIIPPDCLFTYRRGRAGLEADYPAHMSLLRRGNATTFDIVEYISPEQITCLVVGAPDHDPYAAMGGGGQAHVVLHDLPNRAGIPLCIAPGRVTLDRPLGQFDGLVGMYQLQGRLMALHVQAVQRGVFPETWAVSSNGQPVDIVTTADGLTGRIGKINNGQLTNIPINAGVYTPSTMDRIEYAERHEGGIPAEFGGSGASNVRTGQRGAQILSATVDFRVQELQQILEASLEAEIRAAITVARAYTSTSHSMYVPGRGNITYTPESDFDDTIVCNVSYAYAGADINNLVITGGQRLGLETMSRETFMEMDPAVRDVEVEKDRIKAEQLERAFWQSIQAQAADPASPFTPADYALLNKLIITNKMDQYDAVAEVQLRVQQRQAAAQQGQLGPVDAQPGLAMPGAPGTNEAGAAIAEPGPSLGNLTQMLAGLRMPQMVGEAERRGAGQ